MPRLLARQPQRGERGSVTVELVVLMPALLLLVFGGIQAGVFFHARTVAIAAAQEGARVASKYNGTLSQGRAAATSFATEVGATSLGQVSVVASRTGTTTTVTVRGTATRLVPGLQLDVEQTAVLPVERITR